MMYLRSSVIFSLLLVFTYCGAEELVREENVAVLNAKNFDEVIKSHQYVLVEFCEYPIF